MVAFAKTDELGYSSHPSLIRPFTIGRKNWLFNNTIRGAEASAAIYSVVETAKANNLKPYLLSAKSRFEHIARG